MLPNSARSDLLTQKNLKPSHNDAVLKVNPVPEDHIAPCSKVEGLNDKERAPAKNQIDEVSQRGDEGIGDVNGCSQVKQQQAPIAAEGREIRKSSQDTLFDNPEKGHSACSYPTVEDCGEGAQIEKGEEPHNEDQQQPVRFDFALENRSNLGNLSKIEYLQLPVNSPRESSSIQNDTGKKSNSPCPAAATNLEQDCGTQTCYSCSAVSSFQCNYHLINPKKGKIHQGCGKYYCADHGQVPPPQDRHKENLYRFSNKEPDTTFEFTPICNACISNRFGPLDKQKRFQNYKQKFQSYCLIFTFILVVILTIINFIHTPSPQQPLLKEEEFFDRQKLAYMKDTEPFRQCAEEEMMFNQDEGNCTSIRCEEDWFFNSTKGICELASEKCAQGEMPDHKGKGCISICEIYEYFNGSDCETKQCPKSQNLNYSNGTCLCSQSGYSFNEETQDCEPKCPDYHYYYEPGLFYIGMERGCRKRECPYGYYPTKSGECETTQCGDRYLTSGDGKSCISLSRDEYLFKRFLPSVSECNGEMVAQNRVHQLFQLEEMPFNKGKKCPHFYQLKLIDNGSMPPDGFRFVYVDEVISKSSLKERIKWFLVFDKSVWLVNGFFENRSKIPLQRCSMKPDPNGVPKTLVISDCYSVLN